MRLLSLSEVSIQKRTSPDKFSGKMGIREIEISFAISPVLAFEISGQPAFSATLARFGISCVKIGQMHEMQQVQTMQPFM